MWWMALVQKKQEKDKANQDRVNSQMKAAYDKPSAPSQKEQNQALSYNAGPGLDPPADDQDFSDEERKKNRLSASL